MSDVICTAWLCDKISQMENAMLRHNNYSLGYLRACSIIKGLIKEGKQ